MYLKSDVVNSTFVKSMRDMLISNFAILICPFVDGVMISMFLGQDNMTAYGIDAPLISFAMMLCFLFTSGMKTVCSKLIGQGELKKAKSVYSVTLIVMTAAAVLLSVFLLVFKTTVSLWLGASDEYALIKTLAEEYIVGFAPGIPFLCIQYAFSFVLYLNGKGNLASVTVIIQAIVDIVGNLMSVFVFHNGILGMGASTSASNIVATLVGGIFILTKTNGLRFVFHDLNFNCIRNVLIGGIPSAVERFYVFFRTAVFNRILISIASMEAVAAFSILNSLNPFYAIGTMCLSMTVLPMTGGYYGEKDAQSLKKLFSGAVKIGVLMQVIIGVIVIVTAPLAVGIFCAEKGTVYSLAVRGAMLVAISLPFAGLNAIYQNYIYGMGAISKTCMLSFCNNFFFRIAGALLLGNLIGCDGVWLSFAFGEIITIIIVFIFRSVKSKHPAVRFEDYTYMTDEIGHLPDFQITVNTIENLISASENISEYVKQNGGNSRTAYVISLSVEELGRNIIVWGGKDQKNTIMDIRITKDDNGWILRIRDNSRIIDPNRWVQLYHPEDETANIGFRIMAGISKDIQYTGSFGINNLIVRI